MAHLARTYDLSAQPGSVVSNFQAILTAQVVMSAYDIISMPPGVCVIHVLDDAPAAAIQALDTAYAALAAPPANKA